MTEKKQALIFNKKRNFIIAGVLLLLVAFQGFKAIEFIQEKIARTQLEKNLSAIKGYKGYVWGSSLTESLTNQSCKPIYLERSPEPKPVDRLTVSCHEDEFMQHNPVIGILKFNSEVLTSVEFTYSLNEASVKMEQAIHSLNLQGSKLIQDVENLPERPQRFHENLALGDITDFEQVVESSKLSKSFLDIYNVLKQKIGPTNTGAFKEQDLKEPKEDSTIAALWLLNSDTPSVRASFRMGSDNERFVILELVASKAND